MMDKKLPRRALLKGALAGLAAIPVVTIATRANAAAPAAAPAKLDESDPTAKSLGYVHDTKLVDAKTNPTHKPEQHCGNCIQYKGKPTDATAPCTIFGGKLVAGTGWCKVWAKNPAVA